jgi:hypothetical protein
VVNFHKVLISAAIVFTLGFAVWSGLAYKLTGETWALASASGYGLATIVLVLYLKNLKRFLGQ